VPADRRTLSYRLTFGASDRTLSSEEFSAIRTRIIDGMREAGYDLKV
jgi:phenylalanyl-tRNA synthetase beta subunit